MSLPPERISIKRRRQEEPVELFSSTYLEKYHHENKRRFTDYCFQRARLDAEAPARSILLPREAKDDSERIASSHAASGIPVVRATSPGAEIREEAERRLAQKALREHYLLDRETSERTAPEFAKSKKALADVRSLQHTEATKPVRRFHLCRGHENSHLSPPNHYSGIRKRKTARRNYLATFVERSKSSALGPELLNQIANPLGDVLQNTRVKNSSGDRSTEEFHSPLRRQVGENGRSMHDHPSTWDHDSDQLAEELAAFALGLSQNEKREEATIKTTATYHEVIEDATTNVNEDWVYDTYVRVPISVAKSGENPTVDAGLLVIDDEDQELWQTFGESDNESEWDQEDPDSNAEDNPANEYPDEEVDSEDEYGQAYMPRNSASGDEEYDLQDPWSDSDR